MSNFMDDFYEGAAEETEAKYKRMRAYIDLALSQGDAIFQEKPFELTIKIRLPKKEKGK